MAEVSQHTESEIFLITRLGINSGISAITHNNRVEAIRANQPSNNFSNDTRVKSIATLAEGRGHDIMSIIVWAV